MCHICALTQSFEPARHSGATTATDFAAITEGSDAAASTGTGYAMAAGDVFTGTLASAGDRDWVRVTLDAGTTYQIDLSGSSSEAGTLPDPYLRLYNSAGDLVALDDDTGARLDAHLSYTPTSAGSYYIAAGAYNDQGTGSYRIAFDRAPPPAPVPITGGTGTLDELAAFLTDGYWADSGRSRHAFDTSEDHDITVDITALTAEGQRLARWAFEAWEQVADIRFIEVSGAADITFDDKDSGAYATASTSGDETLSAEVNISRAWLETYGTSLSSYAFTTYLHEIGHALGLGHQGAYNGNASYGRDESFRNDSYQLSVMSYFSQSENTTVNADYALPVSAMMADIVAIQDLYGGPDQNSQTAGNTVWGTNTTLTGYLADVFAGLDGSYSAALGAGPVTLTLYDRDGLDLIDLSSSRANNRLDLNDMGISDIGGLTGNLMIARDTVIENASLGRGHDTVIGNEADNRIIGRQGRDHLSGAHGADRLFGGGGADRLNGGRGQDRLFGGGGRDRLLGDGGADRLFGKGGNDRLVGGSGNDLLVGGAGADRFVFSRGSDRDRIRDFQLGTDRVLLDRTLTDGLTDGAEIWDRFGQVQQDKLLLVFGDGDVLKILGTTDSAALADDIFLI